MISSRNGNDQIERNSPQSCDFCILTQNTDTGQCEYTQMKREITSGSSTMRASNISQDIPSYYTLLSERVISEHSFQNKITIRLRDTLCWSALCIMHHLRKALFLSRSTALESHWRDCKRSRGHGKRRLPFLTTGNMQTTTIVKRGMEMQYHLYT